MITYRKLNTISATVCMILSILAMFFPEVILFLFQIDGCGTAFIIGRRASILFLGMATLLWLDRKSNNYSSIQAVCAGMIVLWVGLAIIGSIELLSGNVGARIVLPIIIESLLGISYFKLWHSNRDTQ